MNKAFSPIEWQNEPSVESPINADNLNRIENGLNEVDNRVVQFDVTKANVTDIQKSIVNVEFDEDTGEFRFTHKDGSSFRLDTKLEKLVLNWRFDADTQTLYLILEDGSEMPIDLSALIVPNEFIDSDTIYFTVMDGGKVTASIKNGSITPEMLEPNYLADVTVQAELALRSAQNANQSELNAKQSELNAKSSEDACEMALEEVTKKTALTQFNVNYETGNLEYDSPQYNFSIDNTTGNLMWEVAE